jgi:hypothetical protein
VFAFLTSAVRRLAGVAVLALLTVGVPYALARYTGWPLPRQVPTWHDVAVALTSPLTDTLLGNTLLCALWATWAAFVWSVLAEFATTVAGVRLPQPRAFAPVRGLAALLVAVITGGVLATAAQAAPPLTQPAAATTHTTAVSTSTHIAPGPARLVAVAAPAPHSAPVVEQPASAPAVTGHMTVVAARQHYTCVVRHGDTLSEIAERWLGDANRWPEIFALNRGTHFTKVGGTFSSPHLIYPGWTLELPEDANPPTDDAPAPRPRPAPPTPAGQPSTAPTQAPDQDDAPEAPAPTSTTAALPAPDDSPAAPPSTSGGAATTPTPSVNSDTTSSPDSSTSATPQAPVPAAAASRGISLGSGSWMDMGLVTAVLAAVTLLWAHRRRRYTPRPPSGQPRLDDPDLRPMPKVINQVRRRVRETAPNDEKTHLFTPPPVDGADDDQLPQLASAESLTEEQSAPEEATEDLPAPAPVVPALDNPLAAVWPPAGVGLTGPGALAAARGFLTAALAAGGLDDPNGRTQVVIPASAATALLDMDATQLPDTPRLTVTEGLSEALGRVSKSVIAIR